MSDNEKITVEFDLFKWESLRNYLQLTNEIDYTIKSIKVQDDMFKDDDTYKLLKKDADKSYKKVEEYKFKKRHNIK